MKRTSMENITRMIKTGLVTLTLVLLVACSGSSSDDSQEPGGTPDNMLTGTFVDSPVAGLQYITSSGLSGLTNAAGEFQYLLGDVVTFSINELVLGSINGAATITPFDLVGFELNGENLSLSDVAQDIVEADLTGSATKFEHGVNMLILLQSLDSNNNPDDGIEIATAVFQFFTTAFVSLLLDVDTRDFVQAFLNIFIQLVTLNHLDRDADDVPVDRDEALLHFLANT